MNRKIKFRAWDDINKEMIYPKEGFFEGGKSHGFIVDNMDYPMQYTEVLDCNSKPIYDGDIVLRPTGSSEVVNPSEVGLSKEYRVYRPLAREKYVVFNIGYAFTIGTEDNKRYCGVLNNAINNMGFDLEVIGNIYENPELLKG